MPALRLFLEMADSLLKQAKRRQPIAPILMVCSESDRVTDRGKQKALFKAIVQRQPQSWYHCFDKRYKIRHRMMTKVEGNEYQDLVTALAKAYITDDSNRLHF
jgi:hypothetical protein